MFLSILIQKTPRIYFLNKTVTSVTGIHDCHNIMFPVKTYVFSSCGITQNIRVFFKTKRLRVVLQSFHVETRFNFCHIPIFSNPRVEKIYKCSKRRMLKNRQFAVTTTQKTPQFSMFLESMTQFINVFNVSRHLVLNLFINNKNYIYGIQNTYQFMRIFQYQVLLVINKKNTQYILSMISNVFFCWYWPILRTKC